MTAPDDNPYVTTATGGKVHLLAPSPLEMDLTDIAQALSRIQRFNGHTVSAWSIAEHCLLVTAILRHQGFNERMQIAGLLHDAAEAYICDIPSPLKWAMESIDGPDCAYRQIERRIEGAIAEAFTPIMIGAPDYVKAAIKRADLIALATEIPAFMAAEAWTSPTLPEPFNLSPHRALDALRVKLGLARGLSTKEFFLLTHDVLLHDEVNAA